MVEKNQPKKSEKEEKKEEAGKIGRIDIETAQKIQELQLFEQNLQNLVMQNQAFQLELNETLNALAELHESKDDVYKIIGSIMLHSNKSDLEKDLKNREEALSLRIRNIEKQEDILREKLLKTREEVMRELK